MNERNDDNASDHAAPRQQNATQTRQGVISGRVSLVLACSLVLAVVAMVVVAIW